MTTCPCCNSRNTKAESLLGVLGRLQWHRCRYCGMEYSHTVKRGHHAR